MAIDTIVFNQFAHHAASLTIKQNYDMFNEKSAGAILLYSDYNVGHKSTDLMFSEISNFVRRRDANNDTAVASVPLEQFEMSSIRINAGTKPVEIKPQDYSIIQMDPKSAGMAYGSQLAAAMPADQLNAAIGAAAACIESTGAVGTLDKTAVDVSLDVLNEGSFLFGDRAMDLVVWVVHSHTMQKIFGEALQNTFQLHQFGSIRIMSDPWGRSYLMTDSPALVEGGGVYRTIGLSQGAIRIENNNDMRTVIEQKTGSENLREIMQSEWSFNSGIKGYDWLSTDTSPNDAALMTDTNWGLTVGDIKNSAGVMIRHK